MNFHKHLKAARCPSLNQQGELTSHVWRLTLTREGKVVFPSCRKEGPLASCLQMVRGIYQHYSVCLKLLELFISHFQGKQNTTHLAHLLCVTIHVFTCFIFSKPQRTTCVNVLRMELALMPLCPDVTIDVTVWYCQLLLRSDKARLNWRNTWVLGDVFLCAYNTEVPLSHPDTKQHFLLLCPM